MKAILVIDDIPDEYKDYMLKATFTLWKIQDGVLQEIGIHGNDFIKPLPDGGLTELYMKHYRQGIEDERARQKGELMQAFSGD